MKSYKALFHIKDTVPTEGVTDWFNDRYGTSSHLVKLISKNNHDYIFKITDLTKLRIESTKDFIKFIEDKNMSRKLFAELKSKCRTKSQMKAFNSFVKSFANEDRFDIEVVKQQSTDPFIIVYPVSGAPIMDEVGENGLLDIQHTDKSKLQSTIDSLKKKYKTDFVLTPFK